MCCLSVLTTHGGDEESRTPDLVLARHALYQLSYAPKLVVKNIKLYSFECSTLKNKE